MALPSTRVGLVIVVASALVAAAYSLHRCPEQSQPRPDHLAGQEDPWSTIDSSSVAALSIAHGPYGACLPHRWSHRKSLSPLQHAARRLLRGEVTPRFTGAADLREIAESGGCVLVFDYHDESHIARATRALLDLLHDSQPGRRWSLAIEGLPLNWRELAENASLRDARLARLVGADWGWDVSSLVELIQSQPQEFVLGTAQVTHKVWNSNTALDYTQRLRTAVRSMLTQRPNASQLALLLGTSHVLGPQRLRLWDKNETLPGACIFFGTQDLGVLAARTLGIGAGRGVAVELAPGIHYILATAAIGDPAEKRLASMGPAAAALSPDAWRRIAVGLRSATPEMKRGALAALAGADLEYRDLFADDLRAASRGATPDEVRKIFDICAMGGRSSWSLGQLAIDLVLAPGSAIRDPDRVSCLTNCYIRSESSKSLLALSRDALGAGNSRIALSSATALAGSVWDLDEYRSHYARCLEIPPISPYTERLLKRLRHLRRSDDPLDESLRRLAAQPATKEGAIARSILGL